MNRGQRKRIAEQTVAVLDSGNYKLSDGMTVSLEDELEKAVKSTKLYRPYELEQLIADQGPSQSTLIEVRNETTFAGARELIKASSENAEVCALNFASAKNPGGGFLGGSQAQEEALARASGLYACLAPQAEYYDFHRSGGNALYSHHMIYSPRVPVFRDDRDELLATPWFCSIITSPAVNAGAVRKNTPELTEFINSVMERRIELLLRLAQTQKQSQLVLGAWGCGVFGNDPSIIAKLFRQHLNGTFKGVFRRIRFSVLDHSNALPTYSAFKHVFEEDTE